MARVLIVGCGCRGRELGRTLAADGWAVRGTSRTEAGLERIAAAGIEPAPADPDRAGSIVELVGDVAVVVWALGSASGTDDQLDAVHGPRLERVLEHLVDTPVRGFVYEAAGTAGEERLGAGGQIVAAASSRWRIPASLIQVDGTDASAWLREARTAVTQVLGA